MRELWLEFEEWEDAVEKGFDPENSYCNVLLKFDGREYALNVWTYGFMRQQLEGAVAGDEKCVVPPDLLVPRLQRRELEDLFDELIRNEGVKETWLVPMTG